MLKKKILFVSVHVMQLAAVNPFTKIWSISYGYCDHSLSDPTRLRPRRKIFSKRNQWARLRSALRQVTRLEHHYHRPLKKGVTLKMKGPRHKGVLVDDWFLPLTKDVGAVMKKSVDALKMRRRPKYRCETNTLSKRTYLTYFLYGSLFPCILAGLLSPLLLLILNKSSFQLHDGYSFEEKMSLLDSVLAETVFETSVTNVPLLSAVFKHFEQGQDLFVENLNMLDYDNSCNKLYDESTSMSRDFDKEFYGRKEFIFKVI